MYLRTKVKIYKTQEFAICTTKSFKAPKMDLFVPPKKGWHEVEKLIQLQWTIPLLIIITTEKRE